MIKYPLPKFNDIYKRKELRCNRKSCNIYLYNVRIFFNHGNQKLYCMYCAERINQENMLNESEMCEEIKCPSEEEQTTLA